MKNIFSFPTDPEEMEHELEDAYYYYRCVLCGHERFDFESDELVKIAFLVGE